MSAIQEYLAQLQDFIAINAITNLRKVLIFDTETPLGVRLPQAKAFLSQEMLVSALRETRNKHRDRKERLKAFLALHKCMGALYLLFAVKEFKLTRTNNHNR